MVSPPFQGVQWLETAGPEGAWTVERHPTGPPRRSPSTWLWPLALVTTVGLLVAGWLWTIEAPRQLAAEIAAGVTATASGWRSGTLTTHLLSSLTRVTDAGLGRLEVAVLEANETLRRVDDRRLMWDLLPLGRTVVELEVPVVYRYHLPLDGEWRIVVAGPVIWVFAPGLEPSLPPAIRTEGLRRRVETSWLRFDGGEQAAELERQLTALLSERAAHPDQLALARPAARRTLARLVKTWVESEGQWGSGRIQAVGVVFADEAPQPPVPLLMAPAG